ncbi:hypothetical protein GN244_ATG15189 [Phytophthora infestans]|uniref:Uncharacterized protein n=1 Tax=Phytophthora infestans TaxID=4787 RepID=A0A833S4P7_PHYIN|nr:hypothetical protein GN244_ATG15189 [Phytophthora infestans]
MTYWKITSRSEVQHSKSQRETLVKTLATGFSESKLLRILMGGLRDPQIKMVAEKLENELVRVQPALVMKALRIDQDVKVL